MIKYKATRYAGIPEIYPVEVLSETEHFNSFEEAKTYLIEKQEEKMNGLRKEFLVAQAVLREINSMKENGNEY